MLKTARAQRFTIDAVQMPLNVMDAHFDSFEARVLPVLAQHEIGVYRVASRGGIEPTRTLDPSGLGPEFNTVTIIIERRII